MQFFGIPGLFTTRPSDFQLPKLCYFCLFLCFFPSLCIYTEILKTVILVGFGEEADIDAHV